MSTNDCLKRLEKLTLTAAEERVAEIDEEEITDFVNKRKNDTVVKIFSTRPVIYEVFRMIMPRIWNNDGLVKFEKVGQNIFLCKFKTDREKRRIVEGGPWFFDKALLIFADPDGRSSYASLDFRFWWGASGDDRKIHWQSWKKLCIHKDQGGMGFRDLSIFNQALLAKQSWRLIKNPESLLARVLRGRYYHSGNFLKAWVGHNPSFTWQSIIWGRKLFEKGYRWRIGNGMGIVVGEDPWLPREGIHFLHNLPFNIRAGPVANFLTGDNCWNVQLIRHHFPEEVADRILSIPLSILKPPDEIIWALDKKGMFKVKSAYRLGMTHMNMQDATTSNTDDVKAQWRSFWKAKVPPKVKIFCWKLYHDILPHRANLVSKGLKISKGCVLCNLHEETASHLFWNCKFTKKVWTNYLPTNLNFYALHRDDWSTKDYFDWLWEHAEGDARNDVMLILWKIWGYRNQTLHNNRSPNLQTLSLLVNTSIDLKRTREEISQKNCAALPSVDARRWTCPPEGFWKLNVDASWNASGKRGAIAWVLRNSTGALISAGCRWSREDWAICVLEAQAINVGMESIPISGSYPVQVESDCLQVIKLIRGEEEDITEVGLIVAEITLRASRRHFVSFDYVPRSQNGVAHFLACLSSAEGLSEEWGESPPKWLSDALLRDYSVS